MGMKQTKRRDSKCESAGCGRWGVLDGIACEKGALLLGRHSIMIIESLEVGIHLLLTFVMCYETIHVSR